MRGFCVTITFAIAMAQRQEQIATQEQKQELHLTALQILATQMVALPIVGLEQRVDQELIDNPALEKGENDEEGEDADFGDEADGSMEGDDLLSDYANDIYEEEEEIPVRTQNGGVRGVDLARAGGETALEQVDAQIRTLGVSEREREVLGMLLLFLDERGLLRESTARMREELRLYHDFEVSEAELRLGIRQLQTLEPRGLGAQTLRECLILQVTAPDYESPYKEVERAILTDCYDSFMARRLKVLAQRFKLGVSEVRAIYDDMRRRLTPSPLGGLTGDGSGEGSDVVPDFMVRELADGRLAVRLNGGDVPTLRVSREFEELVQHYKGSESKREQEAYVYAKDKVDRARGFITAVRQRRDTLLRTMKTIVEMQEDFFRSGDESVLKPMILKDVAERVGVDRSTISRVNNSKFVDTVYGVFPLKFFFDQGFKNEDGEEVAKTRIRAELRRLIESEDKDRPLGDEELAALLGEKGFGVARRTVAKYRTQMGIPIARLRK